MNLKKRTIGISDATRLTITPHRMFEKERVPQKVLQENAEIHQRLGADNTEEVELRLGDWVLRGVPDQIYDDRIVEVKVRRPASRVDELFMQGLYQAATYARALDMQKAELWIYNISTGEVEAYEYNIEDVGTVEFLTMMEANLNRLSALRSFFNRDLLDRPSMNKITVRRIRAFTI